MTRKQDAKTSRLAATPVSVLDLAYMRQGGTAAEAFDRSLDLAQHAEQWGYRRFWLAEHHGIDGVACSATSVLIGHVAAGTKRIRVGSGGVMLPNDAPLAIAEQFGTLETLFPGRIDLGLGRAPGGDPAVARALRRTLYTNGDDFPELLRELQRYLGDPVAGQVMAIPGAGTKVPVWLLGSSGFSAHLAGTMGLPFAFAAHFMPDNLLPALELYRSSFEPSEVLDKPYAMAAIPVMAAGTDAQAAFLATSMQQAFLNLIRNKPGPLSAPVEKIEWNPLEQMTVEAKMRAAIVGSRETVERKLEEFLEETQVDELMVVSNAYEQSDRLRSYEIVSQIHREAGQEQVVAA